MIAMPQLLQTCNKNVHLVQCYIFHWVILSDTFILLKLPNHGDRKKWAKWLIFNIFVSPNSNELQTTSFSTSKLTVSFIDSKFLPIIILKGKILVLGKEPSFYYWAILSLEFIFPVLSPTNKFSCNLNILENLDINAKLF